MIAGILLMVAMGAVVFWATDHILGDLIEGFSEGEVFGDFWVPYAVCLAAIAVYMTTAFYTFI